MSTGRAEALLKLARQEVDAIQHPRHREYLAGRARAEAFLVRARLRGLDITTGEGLRFVGGQGPIFRGSGSFRLGDNCSFRAALMRSRLATAPGGTIAFGDRTGFNYGLEIHSSKLVEIGDYTMGGAMVTIYDTNFHQIDEVTETKTEPVRIGRHVWLAHACTVLPGVTIGDHAVIGAGAVISRDVPPRTLMAGNPAKPVRELVASPDWSRW
jgi:acetyltransferase-like isoleucine patch superfamily enzyme